MVNVGYSNNKEFHTWTKKPLKDFGVQKTTIRIHQHVTCPLSSEVACIQKVPEEEPSVKIAPKIDGKTMGPRMLQVAVDVDLLHPVLNVLQTFPNTQSMVYLPTFG